MKNTIIFYTCIAFISIFSPAFQCNNRVDNLCPTYKTDTAISKIDFQNFNLNFHVGDTAILVANLSDTVHTKNGEVFFPSDPPTSKFGVFQAYKVVSVNGLPALNYANIEFNPVVIIGSFPNYNFAGIGVLYNRQAPYNKLKLGLVGGQPGLYLFTVNSSQYDSYYAYRNPQDPCTSYREQYFFPEEQQSRHYWDSLNTSTLRLNGSGNLSVANKNETGYFFLKINP